MAKRVAANVLDLTQAKKEAVSAYSNGSWGLAENLCRMILRAEANYFDALHILSVIMLRTDRGAEALPLLKKAASINPKNAQVRFHLAQVLRNANNSEEAVRHLRAAVSLKTDYFDALFELGNLLVARGEADDAVKFLRRAVEVNPKNPDAQNNLGILLYEAGQIEAALSFFDSAIENNPAHAEAYNNRGNTLRELKLYEEAIRNYDWAISCRSGYAEAHNNKAVTLAVLGRVQESIDSYHRAIFFKNDYFQAFNNLGNALCLMEKFEEAIECCKEAIRIAPDHVDSYNNLGNALCNTKDFNAALKAYNQALSLAPQSAQSYSNRSVALAELHRYDEAIKSAETAIGLDPSFSAPHNNKANALACMGEFSAALESYERAIELVPSDPNPHMNLAYFCLSMGDYERGWREHEWRWRATPAHRRRSFSQPLWLGDFDIANRTILLHAEQGFGDTIQFCRYVRSVADKGARVILQVQTPLKRLLSQLSGVSEIYGEEESLPGFDFHCPLMSLPHAFGTGLETVPCHAQYLSAGTEETDYWHSLLGPKTRPRIGLAWSGNPNQKNDHNRSAQLQDILPLLDSNTQFVVIQRDVKDYEKDLIKQLSNVVFFEDRPDDFSHTAALVANVDMVISVCTSAAHLSGAMGKPTWVMLPKNADWRWLRDRSDSPWYPTIRLFRQGEIGSWESLVSDMNIELRKKLSEPA